MKKYRFNARDSRGQKIVGVVEAVNNRAAAESIRGRDMTLIDLTESVPNFISELAGNFLNRITLHDVSTFTRQLSTMVTAGLQLSNSLSILRSQTKKGFSEILTNILADIQGGSTFASALEKYPKVFPKSYIALIKSGEAAGVLDQVLARLADNLEKQVEFNQKVKGAMVYPIIVISGMILVTIVMMIFVIPQLSSVYSEFGSELPLPTKVLIFVSDSFARLWWLIAAGFVGLVYMLFQFSKTKVGRKRIDKVLLNLPIIGKIIKLTIMTEFSRTMSLMVGTGISIIDALGIVSDSTGNVYYEESLRALSKQVEKGLPIAFVLAGDPLYPPIVSQMISVGEETGKLDDVLLKLSRYFESESDQLVKGLTTAIEPIVLVILGIGIGFLVISIILPMYSLTSKI